MGRQRNRETIHVNCSVYAYNSISLASNHMTNCPNVLHDEDRFVQCLLAGYCDGAPTIASSYFTAYSHRARKQKVRECHSREEKWKMALSGDNHFWLCTNRDLLISLAWLCPGYDNTIYFNSGFVSSSPCLVEAYLSSVTVEVTHQHGGHGGHCLLPQHGDCCCVRS